MPKREPPPIRDPQSPGYVSATMLVDGDVPPIDTTGNYIVGPTHATSKDLFEQDGVPQASTQVSRAIRTRSARRIQTIQRS